MNDNQSESIGELAKALSAAQGKMQAVPRNAENPFFKSSYADLSSIIAAARDILAENGLSIVQFGLPTDNGKVALATQLNHISGQWVRGTMMAKPVKDDPQAMGSCVTYLRRYGWQTMLGLVQEGEDDDGNQASEGGGKSVKQEPSKQTIAQKHAAVFQTIVEDIGAPKTPPAALPSSKLPETPTERKERLLRLFRPFGAAAEEKFAEHGLILAGEGIDAIDDVKVANIAKIHVETLLAEVKALYGGKASPMPSEGDEKLPDDLHDPSDYTVKPTEKFKGANLLTPFAYKGTPAGTPLGDIDKDQLWFWVMLFAPKKWQDKEKRWRDPSKKDVEFFQALLPFRKEIAAQYKFSPPKEREGVTP